MKKLKINFLDVWPEFNKTNNVLWNALSKCYELEISDQPDVLFYSVFHQYSGGRRPLRELGSYRQRQTIKRYQCAKIFFTAECREPNFNICDLAFSFSYSKNLLNYRLPLFLFTSNLVQWVDINQLSTKLLPEILIKEKKKFCCMVVSNGRCKFRNRFFERLSSYKKVDSGGLYANNIGGPVKDKFEFIKDYKFVLSFENQSYPGYVTEKLVDAMKVNSLPVYWGSPLVYQDFNPMSFINILDFDSIDKAIEHIIAVDKDDNLYLSYMKQPWLLEKQITANYTEEAVLARMIEIIEAHR